MKTNRLFLLFLQHCVWGLGYCWMICGGLIVIGAADEIPIPESPEVAATLQPYLDQYDIAGIIAIIANKNGKILFKNNIGYADVEANLPVSDDNVFWIASMTKMFAGASVMMLVDEGKLSLDDPASKFIPSLVDWRVVEERSSDQNPTTIVLKKPARDVTIRHLLSHTSGLAGSAEVQRVTGSDSTPLRVRALASVTGPLQSEPGEKYAYGNQGMNIAARIVEIVSGMSYEDFLQQRFFDPLGMTATTFWPSEEAQKRLTVPYSPNRERTAYARGGIPFLTKPYTDQARRFPEAGGGLFSTTHDIFRYGLMLANDGELNGCRYLSHESMNELRRQQTGATNVNYSLGYHLRNGMFGHDGAYGTDLSVHPETGMIAVFMVQCTSGAQWEARDRFLKTATEVYAKATHRDVGEISCHFDRRGISRTVLEHYLNRAITLTDLLAIPSFENDGAFAGKDDDLRMIREMRPKFIGRSIYRWGREDTLADPRFCEGAKQIAAQIHAIDSDIVLQACLFEIVTRNVDKIAVPDWVFKGLELPLETRNFQYDKMLAPNGKFVDHWRPGSSVPDITQTETQLWFLYLAGTYLEMGCEAFHLGQVELIGMNDPQRKSWAEFVRRLRHLAQNKARRGWVLLDAHTPKGGMLVDGVSLLDFNSFPLRIKDIVEKPLEGMLEVGYLDSLFGRSHGGITPSGWKCESLPYLVEFDNFGITRTPGQETEKSHFIWGYDEISWFYLQNEEYRQKWLVAADRWIKEHDSNGFLQMPVGRLVITGRGERSRFRANTCSDTVPEGMNLEETIKEVFSTR